MPCHGALGLMFLYRSVVGSVALARSRGRYSVLLLLRLRYAGPKEKRKKPLSKLRALRSSEHQSIRV